MRPTRVRPHRNKQAEGSPGGSDERHRDLEVAGEKLQHARLGPLGVEGDRVVNVEGAQGRVCTTKNCERAHLVTIHLTLVAGRERRRSTTNTGGAG
jgi:hypothetical protein